MSELLTPMQAARVAGVSYPTIKQWIYKGKIHPTKTAGGHYRIARSEIERVTGHSSRPKRGKPVGLDAISGRNKLQGSITELRFEGLLVQVTIDVGGELVTVVQDASLLRTESGGLGQVISNRRIGSQRSQLRDCNSLAHPLTRPRIFVLT